MGLFQRKNEERLMGTGGSSSGGQGSADGPQIRNWGEDLVTRPKRVVVIKNENDIAEIIKNKEEYPSPVRALGSRHSNTKVMMADGGTVLDMRQMDRILGIDEKKMTITCEAGALYIDVSLHLQKHGYMHYVNTEFGSLTAGAAANVHTKDASFVGEHGQVSSYVVGVKLVTAGGSMMTVNENENPQLLPFIRSSYGLFGITYEVTYKVKPLRLMRMKHVNYTVEEFLGQLDHLRATGDSLMIYYYPYEDKLSVEFRTYDDDPELDETKPNMRLACSGTRWQYKLRNFFWTTVGPRFAYFITHTCPLPRSLRYSILDKFNKTIRAAFNFMRGPRTLPAGQTNRYLEGTPPNGRITFSLFSFPVEKYPDVLRAYYAFVKEYYKRTGWRTNLLHAGYRILQDTSAVMSHAAHGESISIDPVTVPDKGWYKFLPEYNEFCTKWGGTPLLNQTPLLTPQQVQADAAYGLALEEFRAERAKRDPENRFVTPHLRNVLGL